MIDAFEQRAIAASVELHEYVRRARPESRARRGHREWLHFFVATDAVELFVNLSLFDDLRPAASAPERARVLVLVRTRDGAWDGDVEDVPTCDVDVRSGQLRGRFGSTLLESTAGVIRIRGTLRERAIAFDLELVPETYPSVATDVRVGEGTAINWLVVPRSRATGTVVIDGVAHRIASSTAYHDHNWGLFAHRSFRWQWAHAAAGERAIVLSRLLDGIAGTAYLQTLFVWDGPRIARIFRGRELTLRPHGFLRRRSLTLPRLGSLLASGATEVPARLHLEAHGSGDHLAGELELVDAACLILAEGGELETTLLYEVVGRARLAGSVSGRPFELDAPVVFEAMRSA